MIVDFSENLSENEKQKVLECSKFLEFQKSLLSFDVRKISVLNACFWGDIVGLILVKYEVFYQSRLISQYCSVKGFGTSALIVLTDEHGEDYVVLVGQARFPAGKVVSWELPAGMIDSGTPLDSIVREVREEVGEFGFAREDFKFLTSFYPCSGGSDEKVFIFFLRRFWKKSEILKLCGLKTGLNEENEFIVVEAVPIKDVLLWCEGDAKTMIALLKYENMLLKNSEIKKPD